MKKNPLFLAYLVSVLAFIIPVSIFAEQRKAVIGDRVQMSYQCRLKSGQLAATNEQSVATAPPNTRSPLFTYDREEAELIVSANDVQRPWSEISFLKEVKLRLANSVIGMLPEETRSVALETVVPHDLPYDERYVKVARKFKRLKYAKFTAENFRKRTGAEPQVGTKFETDQRIIGEVVSVNESEVQVLYSTGPESQAITPYGPASIRETEDGFDMTIDAKPGFLIKAGPLAGRIAAVDDEMMTLDFGHPFGGETLICDVTLKSIRPASGFTTATSAELSSDDSVQIGDGVTVQYAVRTEDGVLIATNIKSVANDPTAAKHYLFVQNQNNFQEIIAGAHLGVPGLATEIIGMKPGEKKHVRLPPDKAFGQMQAAEIRAFPSVKKLPKVMVMEPAEFKRHFETEPALEGEVPLTPYFKGKVIAFEGQNAILAALASEGSVEESFGTTQISIENEVIAIKMNARVGADFDLDGKTGRITKADDRNFTVDFNHPLAGKGILLELDVVSLVKAESLKETPLPWMEDHDQGVRAGARQDRPIVLLLYADWCDWCKKLMAESLQDASVKMFRDDFIWVRVDSGKEKAVAEAYEQKSFPLIVILNPKGEVVKKIDGYRDAAALKKQMDEVLGIGFKGPRGQGARREGSGKGAESSL